MEFGKKVIEIANLVLENEELLNWSSGTVIEKAKKDPELVKKDVLKVN